MIAVLIIVDKFANESIFEREECESFLNLYVPQIKEGMLFKIKKFLLPALIACSKHIPYDAFIEKVYNEFKDFINDDIWGVRKVCIEHMADLIKHLKPTDIDKMKECYQFFVRCLNDSNRWVKTQSLIQFGPIVHEFYLKKKDSTSSEDIAALVAEMTTTFYDQKLIQGSEDKDLLSEESIMNKIEEYSMG